MPLESQAGIEEEKLASCNFSAHSSWSVHTAHGLTDVEILPSSRPAASLLQWW